MDSGVAVMQLKGRFEAEAVATFRDRALDQIRAGHKRLVFDFTQVETLDGQGLASFVSFYRKLTQEARGKLVIAGANPEIRQFLDRTSLSRVIPLAYDRQEALQEVRS